MTDRGEGSLGRLPREVRRTRNLVGLVRAKLRIPWLRLTVPGLRLDHRCRIESGCRFDVQGDGTIDLRGVVLADGVLLSAASSARLRLERCSVGPNSVLVAREQVTIGPGSMLAEMVVVRDADHARTGPNRRLADLQFRSAAVEIGPDVWIGAGAVVLRGVTIGAGATVGAGAVVTHDVAAGATVVGTAAHAIERTRPGSAVDGER